MLKKSLLVFVMAAAILVTAGCNKTEAPADLQGEIDTLQTKVIELTEENEALKTTITSLQAADTESLLELRNTLDSNLYGTLNALIRGEHATALESFTSSVEIKDNIVVSLYGKGTVDFTIPERPMNLRQRAFWQDGASYNAIYEIFDAGYKETDERLNTLNVLYLKQDEVWKIDAIFIDE